MSLSHGRVVRGQQAVKLKQHSNGRASVARSFTTPQLVDLDSEMKQMVLTAARARHVGGAIVPLFANTGVAPMLLNLLCSMRRIQVQNWMVVAMDNRTCASLPDWVHGQGPHSCMHPYEKTPLAPAGKLKYASPEFWRLVVQRPLWVRYLLSQGYNVLQCDVDIVWLRNPFPAFERPRLQKQHLISQSEQVYGPNCGFYYARASNLTVGLMSHWIDDMMGPEATHLKEGNNKPMHEQHSYRRVISWWLKHQITRSRSFEKLRHKRFSEAEFPNGKIWFDNWERTSKESAYIIHVNWVQLAKKTRMRRDNLWFLTPDDRECAADFDPFAGHCQRLCSPVLHCQLGEPCKYLERSRCRQLQERVRNAAAALRTGKRRYSRNWHPMALASLGCEWPAGVNATAIMNK